MALPTITITNGTLVADPEVRYTNNGKAVASIRVASNSRRKNQQTGTWENADSTFLTCIAWEGHAENIASRFSKGSKINLTGSLRQREYEKDGQKRTVFEVVIESCGVPVSRFSDKDSNNGASSGHFKEGTQLAPLDAPF